MKRNSEARKRSLKEESDEDDAAGENDEESENEDGDGEDNSNDDESDDNEDSDDDNSDEEDDEEDEEDDDNNGASENEEEDEEEEEEYKPAAKKARTISTGAAKKTVPAKKAAATKKKTKSKTKAKASAKNKKVKATAKKSGSAKEMKIPKSKVLTKVERLEEARKAYKWWEAPTLAKGINWYHMEHAGIAFAPPYVPHKVPLYYDGNPMELTPEQEEVASFYAAMPLDGPQLGNDKTREVFQQNFFDDFKEVLGNGHPIKQFSKCDFEAIRRHLTEQKNLKKAATDEEKFAKKAEKEIALLRYGYAMIDGRLEKMGNFNMEPPGLFRGRGEHPKTGMLKRRCFAEQVSLNLSTDACVPVCSMPGHAWQSVRHDPTVTWLCGWNENVQNQNKYVMLAASSSFKGKSDMNKYGKAIELKSHINKVRRDYTSKINDKDLAMQQLGTAMWVIDVLALRVGGEKGEDEADTVGCCSLRVEHLSFNPEPDSFEIELEFLGKDSMLYKQNINFAQHGELGRKVYERLKRFCKRKDLSDDVFETLTPPTLNKHLQSLMKGLTAKVFRTFNASVTLERELPAAADLNGMTVADKVISYNTANREVAILCNHQKTVTKAAEMVIEALDEKLNTMRSQLDNLNKWRAMAKKGKAEQIKLKPDDSERIDEIQKKLSKALAMKESAATTEEKLNAAEAVDSAKAVLKQDQKRRFEEKHMFKQTPTEVSLKNRIDKWKEDIVKMEVNFRNRDENKEVALGTSKINYMDPRITVAWCKRCEVPIDKVFAKTLRDKFNWAMAVPPDWKFE